MANDPKPITRDQLAKFLGDQESIKRFERLFEVAGNLTPADVTILYRLAEENSIESAVADGKAQTAVDMVLSLAQESAINASEAENRAMQAFDQIPGLESQITTHIASTAAHGATGAVVGTTNTQTLTNKTLTNPIINGFTGDTSVINVGPGQFYKDVSGAVGFGTASLTYQYEWANAGDFSARFRNTTQGAGVYAQILLETSNAFNDVSQAYVKVTSDTSANTDVTLAFGTSTGAAAAVTRLEIVAAGHTRPGADNTYTIGTAARRWSEVFAANGTINTSDQNQKDLISPLEAAEKAVALKIKSLIKKFKYKDAIGKKGAEARTHVGVIAQDVLAAFEEEGLDASRYGLFCSDTWVNNNGDEVTQLGIRYEQLLCFVIAAI